MNRARTPLVRAACLAAALAPALMPIGTTAAPLATTPHICVDQFGYLPTATKIAVIANPQAGFNAGDSYIPGAKLQVRRWDDDSVVFEAAPIAWKGGVTDEVSGDKCWWFDFSAVTAPGRYYVFDPGNNKGTGSFAVNADVYRQAAMQAARMFFYQRCAQAKQPPYVPAQWSDAAAFLGTNQDPKCRLVTAQTDATTERDLHGGWFDAGDYNKYTNFARGALQDLLLAYEDHPNAWGDDQGIPESGNGIPDILDEIKWELDWLLRMQQADGSLLSKVSVLNFESACPPSATIAPRYYGAPSTSSTLTGADIFAHASVVFKSLGQPATNAYAAALATAAIKAWSWATANPGAVFDNTGFASANPETDTSENGKAISLARAACKLFALTGDTRYRDVFDANYAKANLFTNPFYLSPYEADIHSAFLYYLRIPGATASAKTAIANAFQNGVENLGDFLPALANGTDPYVAYLSGSDYTWGSNSTKSKKGGMFLWMLQEHLDPANAIAYRDAAAGFLHYIHGTNPLGLVYLSNMGAFGAARSASRYYHSWFGAGIYSSSLSSPASPAPGYLTGGPDATYAPDPSYTGPRLAPPLDQPAMKSYRDWNTGFPEDSWEVTEPAIYYQAAYVRLVAGFLADDASAPSIETQPHSQVAAAGQTATFSVTASGALPMSFQWSFNGSPIAGATSSSYSVGSVQAANAGSYAVSVTNRFGTATSGAATLAIGAAARLVNISSRAQVGTGGNILIPGFVISGDGAETLLIRGIGPSLAQFGVPGALAQPSLSVLDSKGNVIASNVGWSTNPDPTQVVSASATVGAFSLPPASNDCALIISLPEGAYSVQVGGMNSTTGIALAEIYEVSSSGTRLINISTRAQVGTGANVAISGFVISGNRTETLLIRAIGPGLAQFGVPGVLAQTSLSVFDDKGNVIESNTGWGANSNTAQVASVSASAGAFSLSSGSADSALVVSLSPGAYTMQASGVNNSTGVALAEIYETPDQ
jgi:hypothetical protein